MFLIGIKWHQFSQYNNLIGLQKERNLFIRETLKSISKHRMYPKNIFKDHAVTSELKINIHPEM